MAKGRKVRASRAAQGYVEFSHFPPAVHFDLIRKQAVVIPALDRKSGSAGMPRPNPYAVFRLKKKKQAIDGRRPLRADRGIGGAGMAVSCVRGTGCGRGPEQ